jgi:hypothetical protein
MARTYAEQVEEWEAAITRHHSRMATRLFPQPGDYLPANAARGWREATDLADEILGELKAWKEQADGYQASRDLIRERLEFAQREGFEALQRLRWLEENARRVRSYVEEKATCPHCGCWDECEDGCEFFDHRCGEDMPRYQRGVLEARQALDGFAL